MKANGAIVSLVVIIVMALCFAISNESQENASLRRENAKMMKSVESLKSDNLALNKEMERMEAALYKEKASRTVYHIGK